MRMVYLEFKISIFHGLFYILEILLNLVMSTEFKRDRAGFNIFHLLFFFSVFKIIILFYFLINFKLI